MRQAHLGVVGVLVMIGATLSAGEVVGQEPAVAESAAGDVPIDCSVCYNYTRFGEDHHSFWSAPGGWMGFVPGTIDFTLRGLCGNYPEGQDDCGHTQGDDPVFFPGTCAAKHASCIPMREVAALQEILALGDVSGLASFLEESTLKVELGEGMISVFDCDGEDVALVLPVPAHLDLSEVRTAGR